MPKVKLRLGRRSLSGEQKGVDLRIGLDLAAHGRSRVVDVMYLVSGDDDLTEAVEEAQNHGVQVQLIVVPNHASRPMSVAKHLQQAADGCCSPMARPSTLPCGGGASPPSWPR